MGFTDVRDEVSDFLGFLWLPWDYKMADQPRVLQNYRCLLDQLFSKESFTERCPYHFCLFPAFLKDLFKYPRSSFSQENAFSKSKTFWKAKITLACFLYCNHWENQRNTVNNWLDLTNGAKKILIIHFCEILLSLHVLYVLLIPLTTSVSTLVFCHAKLMQVTW